MRSAPSLSASVLAAFDLKELPDLSYGCPSTQQQDELATTLWTNLCQPAWVTLHSCDSGSHRIAKSSVHRLVQAIERRHQYPESPLWEHPSGYQWLHRLVWAVVYVFKGALATRRCQNSSIFCI